MAIDSKQFIFSTLPNTPNFELKFLCISRIIEHKGILEYIQAAKKIKKEYPKVIFTLVGYIDKGYPTKFKKENLENLSKYIQLINFSENIIDLIKECDCFVLPSYREGTSRSILEAASIGRPIITSDVPGCNNIVKDNFNGFLCKPRDSISLYENIKKMIHTNYNLRRQMAENSRKLIENNFDSEIINNKILNIIDL